jgi:hypothetical protein
MTRFLTVSESALEAVPQQWMRRLWSAIVAMLRQLWPSLFQTPAHEAATPSAVTAVAVTVQECATDSDVAGAALSWHGPDEKLEENERKIEKERERTARDRKYAAAKLREIDELLESERLRRGAAGVGAASGQRSDCAECAKEMVDDIDYKQPLVLSQFTGSLQGAR